MRNDEQPNAVEIVGAIEKANGLPSLLHRVMRVLDRRRRRRVLGHTTVPALRQHRSDRGSVCVGANVQAAQIREKAHRVAIGFPVRCHRVPAIAALPKHAHPQTQDQAKQAEDREEATKHASILPEHSVHGDRPFR